MPQTFVITGRVEFSGDANLLLGGRVEAYDRDLPSLEQRGRAPQLLGQSPIADITPQDSSIRILGFRIEFTDEQFRQGERNTKFLRPTGIISPDISFKVFDRPGRELKITRIADPNNIGLSNEPEPIESIIIFNAPQNLEGISIFIEPVPEEGISEYERLVAAIAPVRDTIPLTELTEDDISFLVNELASDASREYRSNLRDSIYRLRRSALLSVQTNIPTEAFFGWGQQIVPSAPSTPTEWLEMLLAQTDDRLREVLQVEINDKTIPDLSDRIPEILSQVERLKVGQGLLKAHRFIGKLLNERTREPLIGLTVQGFDLDAGQEPKDIGRNVSNNEGVFALSYNTQSTPAEVGTNATGRRLRLEILINPKTQEKYETVVQAGSDQDILDIPVPIKAPPEPESQKLENLVPALQIDLPPELLSFLSEKEIKSLSDIRKAGGLSRLEGLPVAADNQAIRLLEAHADLSRISPNVELNAAMINHENHYDSVTKIAQAPRPDFVNAIREQVGDFKAAQLQVAARAQTHFLNNVMFDMATNQFNEVRANNPMTAEKIRCRCRDCEAAVSPLAYLADLLKFITENIKNNGVLVKASELASIFHQPFDLPASCEAVDTKLRQVRLCVEVLRSYLGTRPLADAEKETTLVTSEKDYRIAAYTTLLTQIGTSFAELRLSLTNEPSLRQSLADRLGIDLSHLNTLLLNPNIDPASPKPDDLTEAALERLFGLVDTTHDPLAPGVTPELQTWRLDYLRNLWKQDFPEDRYEDGQNTIALKQLPPGVAFASPLDDKIRFDTDRQQLIYKGEMTVDDRNTLLALSPEPTYQQAIKQLFHISQRLPIIDPDLIGPDDFRRPFLKTNSTDSDQAFDLWKERRDWVDERLLAFADLKKPIRVGEQSQQVPDITALFDAMYQSVTYRATSVIAWTSTTPSSELENLYNNLNQGINVDAIKFRLLDDLNLSVDHFTHLMKIAIKAKAWEADTRGEKVSDDEWREIYSILVQAQKVKLFAAWRKEEQDAGVQLDSQTFWISLRQPQEGDWPPIHPPNTPLIDPAVLKFKDLPEPIAGERAIDLWKVRQTRLEQIPQELATERQNNGFDAMLKLALGNPLPHNLDTLKSELSNSDPNMVANATRKITNDLHLTIESFKRLLVIKAKNDDSDLAKQPTAAEWAELYAILTPARKINHDFPIWNTEEQNSTTGVVYWSALKAKLPLWRASGDARQLWQQALRDRSQSPIIDPDLISPGDLKNPVRGDLAYDIWKARQEEIYAELAICVARPKNLAGLDTNFQIIIGVSVAQFLAIAAEQEKGNVISDRLSQISLEVAEFNYLLRIARLVNQSQPILDLEWENVYSILLQVRKRQLYAEWRKVEKDQSILLSSDFFQIPQLAPTQFPVQEPTAANIWRSSRIAYQDWQDKLQSRIDQEKTPIQALAEAVGTVEEATLPLLRDALILAINPTGLVVATPPGELEVKAKWVTENLLVDARMSGCSMTTRVAQAIETLQGLILALRTGQLEDLYKNFTLTLDNFDEKWKWLGSYASWRAAMFVFLYPENILQPSLRKIEWQTPAFQTLVTQTGSNRRLTSTEAYSVAKNYSKYFQEICTLRVEASCTSRTRLTKGDKYNTSDAGYHCLFYTFGRGSLAGKIYWSTYNFQNTLLVSQTFWYEIEVKGFDNISSILGAVPYQVSPNERYIFLFCKKQEGQNESLIFLKYDLEKLEWINEVFPLELPEKTTRFNAVVKQTDSEEEPPHLAFSLPLILDEFGYPICRGRKMNKLGSGWDSENFKVLTNIFSSLGGMIAKGLNEFYILEDFFGPFGQRLVRVHYYQDDGSPIKYQLMWSKSLSDERGYCGAFSWPNTNGIFLLTVPSSQSPSLKFQQIVGPDEFYDLTSPFPVGFEVYQYRFGYIAPSWGTLDDTDPKKTKRLVFLTDNSSTEIFQLFKATDSLEFILNGRQSVIPSLPFGPFDIPMKVSDSGSIRASLIRVAYEKNSKLGFYIYTYLQEAYYFVPVHLALALLRSGEYLAALDLFRTVYNYTNNISERKIYPGLVTEESLAETYKRTPDWLLDPLNPHSIAATRQNTYTRFTLLSIIRCLLDYADAEFTQDTAESNPRARRLYLTALELLDSAELKQGFNRCDEIIGVLDDVQVPDDAWQIPLQRIKDELKIISDPQRLQPVVNQIQQTLTANAPIEQKFGEARQILNEAIAALPSAPKLTNVIEENQNISQSIQRSILSDSALTTALESVGNLAKEDFQQTVTMVTGISPARLELRTVNLPWLRESIAPPTALQEEIQPSANLAVARRDVGQLDVLAPTYMTTLAKIAADQPMNAVNLATQVQEVHLPQLIVSFCIPANPLLKTLQLRAELNLYKLRTCRNIAGLKRQVEPYSAPTDTTTGLPTIGAGGQLLLPGISRFQPTLYRYQVLIERAKQLVQLAGQIEAAFLATLEKRDIEAYNLLKARQDLNIAQASVQLQNLRITEAKDGVGLANLQQKRAQIQANHYRDLLVEGDSKNEKDGIEALRSAVELLDNLVYANAGLSIGTAVSGVVAAATGAGAVAGQLFQQSLSSGLSAATLEVQSRSTKASLLAAQASLERRRQDWQFQESLATQDLEIGTQQITLANDRVDIVTQEKVIEELKTSNAKDTIEFLTTTKFTNVNLYDWMSGILEGVYRFFLQQATATAKLAENQLAFERQEVPPAYIQADYWNVPSENAVNSTPNTQAPDRKGLTGSARLLQDIYQLDQYAFNTNKRKLQLSKIISLALLAPAEFQRFRETGVMLFSTPMELFDRDFPGHYLRLIRRVRTSVIALIPPTQGIHATLTTTGLSRTVIGSEIFQTVPIRRDPEFVALTSSSNATGLFELESLQPDLLLPFEGNGVDSSWEFRMPKAANQFDYRTIADVLITIEYTALNSFDYRQQVIQTLNPNLSSDRPFSFRNQFADQWYDLNNPEQTKTPMKVKFYTVREDFPPNVQTLKIQQVLLYFVRASENVFELPVTELRFTENKKPQNSEATQGTVGGSATPIDGIISTRRGNAGSWTAMIGKAPIGQWELTLPNTEEVKQQFQNEEIDDILFVVTYSGRTPEWPT